MQTIKTRSILGIINEDEKLDYSITILNALADPIRIRILEYVSLNENSSSLDIFRAVKEDTALIEYHVEILAQSEMLISQNKKKVSTYKINDLLLEKVSNSVTNFLYPRHSRASNF